MFEDSIDCPIINTGVLTENIAFPPELHLAGRNGGNVDSRRGRKLVSDKEIAILLVGRVHV
jgi:hypothetical protein